METQPFLLTELEDLSVIFSPLKTANRIKYTCFTVSNNFLIFGATSGGLYIFRREPCCFLQLLPNKEGSVTQVSLSPDEKLIAFSSVKGIVCILERTSSGRHIVTTSEHQNEHITCLQWNEGNNELFVGDSSGKVSIVTVSVFPTKSMFQTPSFVLMQLDSKIVQMDFNSNMLLVSTLTKCYICDTTKEIFRQVGHKLRDGEYGACIFNTQVNNHDIIFDSKVDCEKGSEYPNLCHLKLLCARPGSRVWEVAIDGTVISTHHFKEALAVPPKKIIFLHNSCSQNSNLSNTIVTNGSCVNNQQNSLNYVEQSFNFQKLYMILSKYFFTFKSDGVYIFDPQKASVVLWNNEITNIMDVKCVDDVLYVWSGCGKMYALNFVPLEKFLLRLYFQMKYLEVAKLCLEYESFLTSQASNCGKLYILHDLDEKLKSCENSEKLCDRLKPFISICKENNEKRKAQKLKHSYLLTNPLIADDRQLGNQKLLQPSYSNLKSRSHSVSPERFQNGQQKCHGSSSSLPDLIKDWKTEDNLIFNSEILVNGKREKKEKSSQLEVDVMEILEICETIKKSAEPSNESIFNLFDQILELCSKGGNNNLELVQPLSFNLYFNDNNIKLISDLFHSSLRSKLVFNWLAKFSGEWLIKAIKNHPEFLVKHHSTQSLEIDYKLSKVLKIFSKLLKENQIVELIKETEVECYYSSLVEVLDIYQDSSLSSASISNLNLANVTSTPKILNIAYFLMTVGQIDHCSKYSFKINLHDMFYLMLKFEESSKKSGKSPELIDLQCSTLFLSYLDKSCEKRELINGCDDLLENYIINCLENVNCTACCAREPNCGCGFPCPSLQPSITMFSDVGHALIDKNWPKNPEKCLEICGRISYLWRYFIFIRGNEPLDDLLPLLLQTGTMQELENRSDEINGSLLENGIKYLKKLKQGFCLNCGEKINLANGTLSWTEFGLFCIKLLGPGETLQLFSKYANDINPKELDQSFYQGLIFSSIMEKHSKGLKKNIVDLLSGKGMHESNRVPVLSEKFIKEVLGKNYTGKYNLKNTVVDSHHWGVKVNYKDNCAVCSLSLDTKVLISEAGLVVFKCSHAFHSACLRKVNLECPLCKTTKDD